MESKVVNMQAKREEYAAKEEIKREQRRPYTSMDDLPDITPRGQREIWRIIFENA